MNKIKDLLEQLGNKIQNEDSDIQSICINDIVECVNHELNVSIVEFYNTQDLKVIFQSMYKLQEENNREQFSEYLLLLSKMLDLMDNAIKWYIRCVDMSGKINAVKKDRKRFCLRNEKYDDPEIQSILNYVEQSETLEVFNYPFVGQYNNLEVIVEYDETIQLFYILHKNKRMYFASYYQSKEEVIGYYTSICCEQDPQSPHYYYDEGFRVKQGDIVIDAGVAEGNFAIEIIDQVEKLYIVECDHLWMEALKHTFAPYGDKVVYIEKFLSDKVNERCTTIDQIIGSGKVNFIKMDVEGAEMEALRGGEKTIMAQEEIICLVCTYHRNGDEEKFGNMLKNWGCEISHTKGYMYFENDFEAIVDAQLRRGIVRGKKNAKNYSPTL